MPRMKRDNFTDEQIQEAYNRAGNLADTARALGVSYPTICAWTTDLGINKKRQGYTAPALEITGTQCRHAREYLGMTRDEFCASSGTGKTAIRKFELGHSRPRRATMDKIMGLFERYNIAFCSDGTFQEAMDNRAFPARPHALVRYRRVVLRKPGLVACGATLLRKALQW